MSGPEEWERGGSPWLHTGSPLALEAGLSEALNADHRERHANRKGWKSISECPTAGAGGELVSPRREKEGNRVNE